MVNYRHCHVRNTAALQAVGLLGVRFEDWRFEEKISYSIMVLSSWSEDGIGKIPIEPSVTY